jgi:predicted nuclease with TOPRIM domain
MSELKQLQETMTEMIRILGNTNAIVEELRTDVRYLKIKVDSLETRFDSLETRFDSLETRFDSLETKVDENHLEVMSGLKTLRVDLDFLQQKTSQNEKDIYRIKKLITG